MGAALGACCESQEAKTERLTRQAAEELIKTCEERVEKAETENNRVTHDAETRMKAHMACVANETRNGQMLSTLTRTRLERENNHAMRTVRDADRNLRTAETSLRMARDALTRLEARSFTADHHRLLDMDNKHANAVAIDPETVEQYAENANDLRDADLAVKCVINGMADDDELAQEQEDEADRLTDKERAKHAKGNSYIDELFDHIAHQAVSGGQAVEVGSNPRYNAALWPSMDALPSVSQGDRRGDGAGAASLVANQPKRVPASAPVEDSPL